MPDLTLVIASANVDKAAEIADILGVVPGLTLVPRPADVPDVEETGETLEANARLKARALCEATGLAAVADDTGLEVDALDGAPGVYSARYSGEGATYADNVAKMLAELARVGATTPGSRRARFRSVAFVAYPDGSELWVEGAVDGTITADAKVGTSGACAGKPTKVLEVYYKPEKGFHGSDNFTVNMSFGGSGSKAFYYSVNVP